MLIIHPQDPSTAFLKVLYPSEENIILDERSSNSVIKKALQENDRIMILGHGCETGLFAPFGNQQFGRLILGPSHVQFLRNKQIIGIWCNANMFAMKYDLTGLFSGMVISEVSEAFDLGFYDVTEEQVKLARELWANDVRSAILGDLSLAPEKMMERPKTYKIDYVNYSSLYYMKNGIEIDE